MKDQLAMMLAAMAGEPWAIARDVLETLIAAAVARPDEARQAVADVPIVALSKSGPKAGRVVRIPIHGMLTGHDEAMAWWFGGVTVDRLAIAISSAAADDTIGTIVLDFDSPGGMVSGTPELAAIIRQATQNKHVVAVANDMAASGAYWLASQTNEIVATPEALVGSVGVFALHYDYSKMLEEWGIKPTYISAGRYKVEGAAEFPLSDEARDHIQSIVDGFYGQFVDAVAAGRNTTPAKVRSDFGEGRVLAAGPAKKVGMVDRVELFGDTIRRLAGVKPSASADLTAAMIGEDPTTAPPQTAAQEAAAVAVAVESPEAETEAPAARSRLDTRAEMRRLARNRA